MGSSGQKKPPAAGKGRPKGSPNKTTAAVKTAILNAFEKVGGQDYLVKVAEDDPKTFCALLAKVLPAELKVEGDVKLTPVLNVSVSHPEPDASSEAD